MILAGAIMLGGGCLLSNSALFWAGGIVVLIGVLFDDF